MQLSVLSRPRWNHDGEQTQRISATDVAEASWSDGCDEFVREWYALDEGAALRLPLAELLADDTAAWSKPDACARASPLCVPCTTPGPASTRNETLVDESRCITRPAPSSTDIGAAAVRVDERECENFRCTVVSLDHVLQV